ncbi:zinc finger protein, putative [Ixodes scapularis]|uniref:Zinc finger protein, putative n=1 Tax=Ixodes scapularis TaxID=6945 RepID=B7PNN8_IXOSC|nr:zinc finger protein, putative [Ixodes scapularis]|eukprot:XP_002400869.1 zinc finger protein, putative [Ixodes scapularis]
MGIKISLRVAHCVDYASGAPVSLHQPHHYERQEFVSGGRESPLVVYHEEPFSQQQPSVSLPVDTYIQVPFGGGPPLVTVATFRGSPVPRSDSQQSLPHYEQEMESRQAEEMVAMSQVLDLTPPESHSPRFQLVLPPSGGGSGGANGGDESSVRLESQLTVGPASAAALGLPVLLDKSSLVACSTSALSVAGPSSSVTSRGLAATALSHRYLLEQAQYLVADLASRDLLPSILQGPCSSASSPGGPPPASSSSPCTPSHGGLSFSLQSKHLLAAHRFVPLHAPPSPADPHAEEEGEEAPLLDSSSAVGLLDVHGVPLYAAHHPHGAQGVSLPVDVFVTERGEVALVSSTGQDAGDLLDDVQQYHAANQACHQNGAIQNYVSSSADLVSTGGTGYGQQLDLTSTEEASTSSRGVQHSVLRMQGMLGRRVSGLASSPSPSHTLARAEVCSAGVSQEELDELQGCSAVSSASQPDSTNSPGVEMAPSPVNTRALGSPGPSAAHSPGPPPATGARPDADRMCLSRFWCDDCGQFYDRECPRHKVQLIVDKPVLTRAWASLPASYLYVHKVSEKPDGDPIYGVFAKKNIPKRTQFGPIEGVLQRRSERPQQSFPLFVSLAFHLYVDEEDGQVVCLDTSDETQSNWMRFVRPAESHAEQNVILVQQGTGLYFNTTRALASRTEMRVWYSSAYAQLVVALVGSHILNQATVCKVFVRHLLRGDDVVLCHNDLDEVNAGRDQLDLCQALPHLLQRCADLVDSRYSGAPVNEEHECNVCHKVFQRKYGLKRHLMMHTGEKKYKCSLCDLRFTHPYNRKRSRPRRNWRNPPVLVEPSLWACPHCRLMFYSVEVLDIHVPIHSAAVIPADEEGRNSKTRLEECPECCSAFLTRAELMKHVGIHGKRGPPRGDRKEAAPPTDSLPRLHKCGLCYKGFATNERLSKHLQVHSNEDAKPLKCHLCDKRFLNNSALTGHLRSHRIVHKLPHQGDTHFVVALQKFLEYNQVRKHIRAFHTNQRFPCPQCPKVFPRQDKLKLHMLCHSEHREFLCALCGKQFKRKDKLKEHMRRLHGPDREAREAARAKAVRPVSAKRFVPKVSPTDYHRFIYKCHTCLLGFKRRGMLVNHLAKRHPDVRPDSVPELNLPILRATRDYYCQYCEKVYRSSSKRKAHIIKNHPGAALPMSNRIKGGVPSVPGEPNPTFSHMVGSVTTQPHNCCLCHKQYASKAKLLQHQRKKHMDMIALTLVSSAQANGNSRRREADLLTRAMSELTQTLTDFRQGSNPASFLSGGPLEEDPEESEAVGDQVVSDALDSSVDNDEVAGATLDQAQINQLLAQYQQQAALR